MSDSNFFNRYFLDEEDAPKQHLAYVAYVDLLGIKQLIQNSSGDDSDRLIKSLIRAWTEASGHLGDNSTRCLARYYTDCVSIVAPAEQGVLDPKDESQFGDIISRLSDWQLSLVLNGFVCRGGLALGNVYVDDLTLVGRAQLDAYLLESTLAKNPRILLDENTVNNCRVHLGYYADVMRSPHERSLLIDTDGRTFLNYLGSIWKYASYGDTEFAKHSLDVHRELIHSRLNDPGLSAVGAKYEWLRDYHNWFCLLDWSDRFDSTEYAINYQSRHFRRFSEIATPT